jgi:hypothetical protein
MGLKTVVLLDYFTESTQTESFLEQLSDTHVLSQATVTESVEVVCCSLVSEQL